MTPNVCFMVNEPLTIDCARSLLVRCGLTVWTAANAENFRENSLHTYTACLIVGLPGLAGLEQLESLRASKISTPTILLADARERFPAARLHRCCALDVLERPLDSRKVLAWVEGIFATLSLLVAERRRKTASSRQILAPLTSRAA